MAKNDFQHGGWNSYTLQYVTLISPGNCTPQWDMWHCNHDSEFAQWQHPAMWHVALGSWHWIRQMAILVFRGPIMCSLKSPCTTMSIVTIALNCLVFEKIAFLYFGDRQTNRWTGRLYKAALAVASGGLITQSVARLLYFGWVSSQQ